MLAWLAGALEANGERNKLQMNARAAASHSFFVSFEPASHHTAALFPAAENTAIITATSLCVTDPSTV